MKIFIQMKRSSKSCYPWSRSPYSRVFLATTSKTNSSKMTKKTKNLVFILSFKFHFFCLTEFSHASSYEHPYYKIKKLMKNLSLEWVFQHRKPIRDGLTTVSSILSNQFIKEIHVDWLNFILYLYIVIYRKCQKKFRREG